MAVGKNKRLSKGKKGQRKAKVDPFSRKEWYDVKAPSIFDVRQVGKTLVNKSTGLKHANDSLKGRVFEVSLADLQKDEEHAFRKIKLRCDEVQGKNCLTDFYGMEFTSDKLRSLVKKWQSLIEASVDVKTTDGYQLRLFVIGFTKRAPDQRRAYAKSSEERDIRKRMLDIMVKETASCTLKEFVAKLIPEVIGREIEKQASSVYPLQNVYVRKVKIVNAPKLDVQRLLDMHAGVNEEDETGMKVDTEFKEQVLESV